MMAMTALQRRTISQQYRQKMEELQEQVRRLRERVHDLEAAAENQTRRHEAEIRKLKERLDEQDTQQLRRETELTAQRHMAIELLARIEKGMV
jgi:predicted RNase H-like nuclease (RuvC/YqgF family)